MFNHKIDQISELFTCGGDVKPFLKQILNDILREKAM
jgi:hypothetical protein